MAKRLNREGERTSFLIAVAIHIIIIGGLTFWAWKTGKFESARRSILQYLKGEKEPRQQAVENTKSHRSATPRIPQTPQAQQNLLGRTRRPVADDAPPPVDGGSFFQDLRPQAENASGAGMTSERGRGRTHLQGRQGYGGRSVLAPPSPPTTRQLLIERRQATAAIESVGAEQISRVGGADVASAIVRLPSTTIIDGKFPVVRGLGDRYIVTTLNGAGIPSADPYRPSASLDLFPAQMVEKVVVSKTFTPDQPGASSGANIDIVTKSFPEEQFATVGFGVSYNNQVTGNERFLTYRGGKLDWLAMDDGSRSIPQIVANATIPPPIYSSGRPGSPTYESRIAQANLLNELTRAMGVTQFAPSEKAPPPDHSFSLAAGDSLFLFSQPLGMFGGLTYRREFSYYEDGLSARYTPAGSEVIKSQEFSDRFGSETVNWSAIATLTTSFAENHQIGLCFFHNQNAFKGARYQVGSRESEPNRTFFTHRLLWVERSLRTIQLKGKNEFPTLGSANLEWLISSTVTTQGEPDTRFFNMVLEEGVYATGRNYLPDPQDPTRYFRNLKENNLNPKVDLSLPFETGTAEDGKLKVGWYLSVSDRFFEERQIYYRGDAPFSGDPNSYLTESNLGYNPQPGPGGSTLFEWHRYISSFNSTYKADSRISAYYGMVEFPFWDRLKLVGGARVESTELRVDSLSYIENSITGARTNSATLNEINILPAAGLIWHLSSNANLRLNWSHTIARPTVRELAAFRSYDPVLDIEVDGNPRLEISEIENYDLRLEWFPTHNELISLSVFRKFIHRPIERRFISMVGDLISYENRDHAEVFGVELELRKSLSFIDPLLADWSLGGNFSWIHSRTPLTATELANKKAILGSVPSSRPLFDQPPYILNVDLAYDNPVWGTSASLVFNMVGPRIVIASLATEDVYEQPAPRLDLILSQKMSRRTSIRLAVRNLLNPTIERTYGKNSKFVYSSFSRGVSLALHLTVQL